MSREARTRARLLGVACALAAALAACSREQAPATEALPETTAPEVRQEAIDLRRASASDAAKTLNKLLEGAARNRDMLHDQGAESGGHPRIAVEAVPGNRLALRIPPGREGDVERVHAWVAQLDVDIDGPDELEVIQLKWASAPEVAKTLNDLLDASERAARARGRCVLPELGKEREFFAARAAMKLKVIATTDNRLVVTVPPRMEYELARLRELIARLDVDVVGGGR